jgi:hypothetical protein
MQLFLVYLCDNMLIADYYKHWLQKLLRTISAYQYIGIELLYLGFYYSLISINLLY